MDRHDVVFRVDGEPVVAWWYPADVRDDRGLSAALAMAHGFGMTRECLLDIYARHFQEAGIGVLLFDHRGFGASGGTPQVLDIDQQRRDWAGAVGWLRRHPDVDPDRLGLWGTSFSGGHVLHTAARDRRLGAAVAQVPYVDGPASLRRDETRGSTPRPTDGDGPTTADWVRHGATLMKNALADAAGARFGRPPRLVPIAGPLGSGAVIAGPGALEGLARLVPDGVAWRNEVAPRVVLQLATDRPAQDATSIACPLLVCVATQDRITPPAPATRVAADAPRGEVLHYDTDHMSAYHPPARDQMLADQTAFLRRNLIGG